MNDHHRHVGDARIKFSLGTKQPADTDGMFHYSFGLLFDTPRGLLLAADSNNHRVQVFSSDDGSLVSKFGGKGDQPGQFQRPSDLALADDLDRIFIIDAENHRIQARSWANEQSFLSCIGRYGSRRLEFKVHDRPAPSSPHRCRHLESAVGVLVVDRPLVLVLDW